jgi:hypothetical protein
MHISFLYDNKMKHNAQKYNTKSLNFLFSMFFVELQKKT